MDFGKLRNIRRLFHPWFLVALNALPSYFFPTFFHSDWIVGASLRANHRGTASFSKRTMEQRRNEGLNVKASVAWEWTEIIRGDKKAIRFWWAISMSFLPQSLILLPSRLPYNLENISLKRDNYFSFAPERRVSPPLPFSVAFHGRSH